MRKAVDAAGLDEREQAADIDPCRRHQRVDQQHLGIEQRRAIELPSLVGGEAADERKAVRMDSGRSEPENRVAGADRAAVEQSLALDRADAEAGEVVIALGIHPRHLGGLAADQRAAGLAAALGDRGDHTLGDGGIELSACIIIEEKQRLGALDDQIVGAHRDQIDPDPVVPPALDRELELGADAVVGGDEQRIAIAGRLEIEDAAESAQIGIGARPPRRAREWADRADQRIARGDRDAGLGVSVALGVTHILPPSHNALGFPRPLRQKGADMAVRRISSGLGIVAALALAGAGGGVMAQGDKPDKDAKTDRGAPAAAFSGNSFEVTGVDVDVRGKDADAARMGGWRLAQRKGWEMLSRRMTGHTGTLSDSALDGLVSGIVVEQEQIGPTRYIARLGVLFDRGRAASLLGVSDQVVRSPAMLLVPVEWSGGTGRVFERSTDWARAWSRFRGGSSTIDYVRPRGTGPDPLLFNAAQIGRRGRGWWRSVLDQYGASDVLIAEVQIHHDYPGGPVVARFSASHGPDRVRITQFALRVDNGDAIDSLLDQGIARIDKAFPGRACRRHARARQIARLSPARAQGRGSGDRRSYADAVADARGGRHHRDLHRPGRNPERCLGHRVRGGGARGAGGALGNHDQPGARRNLGDARRVRRADRQPARDARGARLERPGRRGRAPHPAAGRRPGAQPDTDGRPERRMSQLALPLVVPETSETEFLVSDSNARVIQQLERWATWPVMAGLLVGPRKSGRSLLARIFIAKTGGTMIDDAERASETEIFHAWNRAQASRHPLLIVADAAPPAWPVRLADLRSRLAATPVLEIGAPDDELIPMLLARFFERRLLSAKPDVIAWLARRLERSHVALMRVVDALEDDALRRRSPRLSIPTARIALAAAGLLAEPAANP